MTTRFPYVSMVIPTYNERENIVPLITQISAQFTNSSYEVLIVDDNSTDGTVGTIRRYMRSHRRVRLILHPPPRDLGGSILLGIQQSHGVVLIGMDGDGNHDPKVIPQLIRGVKHADLVVASRFVTGGGMEDGLRYWASYAFNQVLRIVFTFPIRDNTSGFYAIGKTILEALDPKSIFKGYGEYFLRLVYSAQQRGLRIHEVPVYYRNRRSGKSKSNVFTMIPAYLRTARTLHHI